MISQPVSRLRVYAPPTDAADDAAPPPLSAHDPLSVVFARGFVPLWIDSQGLDRKTKTQYADALGWWARLTGDPPVSLIDDYMVSQFVADLMQQSGRLGPQMSKSTVRKHCGHLAKLIAFCGPRSRAKGDRKNLGLVPTPPVPERPRADVRPPTDVFTVAELRQLLAAADRMTAPRLAGVAAPDWWRAMLHVAWVSGLRINALLRLEWRDIAPVEGGGAWLTSRPELAKGRKGARRWLPPGVARELEQIRTGRRLVFGWSDRRWIYTRSLTLLRRLQTLAGLPAERRFGWHGIRRAHATALAAQSLHQGGMSVAQVSLGHSDLATTAMYVAGDVQTALARAAVERLPDLVTPATPREHA